MNKKAQAQSIIIFFVVVVAILIVSIILLRLTNEILTPFASQLTHFNNQSANTVTAINNSFAIVWDWVIVLLFLFNIILLLISSFMVDIHPAFVIVYIICVIFLVIFGNEFGYIIDQVWGSIGTTVETAQTPMQQFIINNFMYFMLGIIALSGLVMYAKFKYWGGTGGGVGGSY